MLTLSRKLPRIWAFRWQVLLSLMNLIEPRSKQKDRQHWYRVSNRADQSKYWWLQSSGEYYRDLLRGHQGQGNTDNTTRQTEYTLIRPWPVSSFSRPTWHNWTDCKRWRDIHLQEKTQLETWCIALYFVSLSLFKYLSKSCNKPSTNQTGFLL